MGRALVADEAGDVISEATCQLVRGCSETRRVMATAADLADGPAAQCLEDVELAVLEEAEKVALEWLRREKMKRAPEVDAPNSCALAPD